MGTFMVVITLALLCLVPQKAHGVKHHPPTTTMNPIDAKILDMKQATEGIARQMLTQQLFVEERIRSDGDSGIKQKQARHKGTKSYLNDIISPALAGTRDIPENGRHLVIAANDFVMNGVEFRTHTNYYRFVMPSKTSNVWHKTEDIPFPEVPHSVLTKHNVTEQILEMREYFRAFKHQDTKIRSDYARYFKPILCYLEGAWVDGVSPNPNSYIGEAMNLEGLVDDGLEDGQQFNPTKIMTVVNGSAYFAHWQTRIVCHPIVQELKLASFYIKDDLAARLSSNKSLYDFSMTYSARFDLAERPSRHFDPYVGYGYTDPRFEHYTILDSIMEEIPGKDNYPAHIIGGAFGLTAFNAHFSKNYTELNIGNYHHWYKVNQNGAMGTKVINRGYADRNLYVAATKQHNVAPLSYTSCVKDRHTHKKNCTKDIARYSYALPLEVVWLTPLLKWTPYNIHYDSGDRNQYPKHGNGKDGRTAAKAMNATNEHNLYHTPAEFFTYHHYGLRYIMDQHGQTHRVVPSGLQTILREIPSVGRVRLRYPVVPTHQEGNTIYKEIDALKELILSMSRNVKYFYKIPTALHSNEKNIVVEEHYLTSNTTKDPHHHDIYLTKEDILDLEHGKTVHVYTSINNGHKHTLEVYADKHIHSRTHHYRISLCDRHINCLDGHTNVLTLYR